MTAENLDAPAERLRTPDAVIDWMRAQFPHSWEYGEYRRRPVDFKTHPDRWWHFRERLRAHPHSDFPVGRIVPNWFSELRENYPERCEPLFVYVSCVDPRRICYTPGQEYGRLDRQVVTSVGKFLQKHFNGVAGNELIDATTVRRYVDMHRMTYGTSEVIFALGADDIQAGYQTGPHSCMSYPALAQVGEHPTRVYDGPDTILALLQKAPGAYSARAICRIDTEPMTYLRIYGDESVMRARLESLGFKSIDHMGNVRLRLALRSNSSRPTALMDPRAAHPICPYIDWTAFAKLELNREQSELDWLRILPADCKCEEVTHSIQCTGGTASPHTLHDRDGDDDEEEENEGDRQCAHCEDWYHEDDDHGYDRHENWICQGCLDNNFTYAFYGRSETHIHNDDVIEVAGTFYSNDEETRSVHGIIWSECEDEYFREADVHFIEHMMDYVSCEVLTDYMGYYIPKDEAIIIPGAGEDGEDLIFHPDNPPDNVRFKENKWEVEAEGNDASENSDSPAELPLPATIISFPEEPSTTTCPF